MKEFCSSLCNSRCSDWSHPKCCSEGTKSYWLWSHVAETWRFANVLLLLGWQNVQLQVRGSESSEIRHADAGSATDAALQLQINSSCLHHPSAVSRFFLPLLQFPQHHIASLRFPASTSLSHSSRFHYSVTHAYVNTHGDKYTKRLWASKFLFLRHSGSKSHRLKKECCPTGGCKCALMHRSNQSPLKTLTNEHSFIYFAIVRVRICSLMPEGGRRISVRRRTSHGMSGERQQWWETNSSVEN